MEEKKYPIFDEEESTDMACEPVTEITMVYTKRNNML